MSCSATDQSSVVSKKLVAEYGSKFVNKVNAVSAKLTNGAMIAMNKAVAVDKKKPDAVAKAFLQANGLRDSSGEYLQLPDFPQYRFLLFVNECPRPDEVRSRLTSLPQWRFLNRRELD